MARLVDGFKRAIAAARDRLLATVGRVRTRWRWFDHLVRAAGRYRGRDGDRLAAALTFYGFLSFFPLIALAYAVTGYLVAINPAVRAYVTKAIAEALPGLSNRIPVGQIAGAKAGAGILGLVGLLWSGLGWIGAWRGSLHAIWHRDDNGNPVLARLRSLAVLFALGLALLASAALSGLATSAMHALLTKAGIGMSGVAPLLQIVAVTAAVGANIAIFLVLFSQLSGAREPWRSLLPGCVFGAVGLEVLKLAGAALVAHTTRNPVYASFAVIAGLLVWINLVSRFVLFTASWTATR
jgi:inner membrane protein YhjD